MGTRWAKGVRVEMRGMMCTDCKRKGASGGVIGQFDTSDTLTLSGRVLVSTNKQIDPMPPAGLGAKVTNYKYCPQPY